MIAALGAFDGFHLGHLRLFETARQKALLLGQEWGVITFRPHPQALFGGTAFRYLSPSRKGRRSRNSTVLPDWRKSPSPGG